MIYEILNDEGRVVNRIIADPDFVDKNFKDLSRDVTPLPVVAVEAVPVKTLEEKVDEITAKIDILMER